MSLVERALTNLRTDTSLTNFGVSPYNDQSNAIVVSFDSQTHEAKELATTVANPNDTTYQSICKKLKALRIWLFPSISYLECRWEKALLTTKVCSVQEADDAHILADRINTVYGVNLEKYTLVSTKEITTYGFLRTRMSSFYKPSIFNDLITRPFQLYLSPFYLEVMHYAPAGSRRRFRSGDDGPSNTIWSAVTWHKCLSYIGINRTFRHHIYIATEEVDMLKTLKAQANTYYEDFKDLPPENIQFHFTNQSIENTWYKLGGLKL